MNAVNYLPQKVELQAGQLRLFPNGGMSGGVRAVQYEKMLLTIEQGDADPRAGGPAHGRPAQIDSEKVFRQAPG